MRKSGYEAANAIQRYSLPIDPELVPSGLPVAVDWDRIHRRSRISSPLDAGPKGFWNRHGEVVLCDRAHGCFVSRSQEQLAVLLVLLVFSKVFSLVSCLADILDPLGRINGVARPNQNDKDRP